MSELIARGGIELNGTERVTVTIPEITADCRVILRSISDRMTGLVIVSELTIGSGFSLASTSPADVGQTVMFDVVRVV